MKRLPSCAAIAAALSLVVPAARAETDARDTEVLNYIPNNTVAALGYYRHTSTSDREPQNLASNQAVFRGAYVLKFGNVAFVPFDAYLPTADVTLFSGARTLHTSGMGDFTYLPTVAYFSQQGENHTYVAFNPNLTMPTGSYDSSKLLNVGANRWVIKPQVMIGQRFLRAFTAELVGNTSLFTVNPDISVPTPEGQTRARLHQDPTFGGEVHLAADLSTTFYVGASYYLTANGKQRFDAPLNVNVDQPTVQALRFTAGIRVEKDTLLLLQYNQDLAASNEGSISRWFGARISHSFSMSPEPNTPAQPAPPPPAEARR